MSDTTIPSAKSFHKVVAENAAQWPERTYVHCIDQDKSLSYGALYGVSNRVARFLKERDIKANERVLLLVLPRPLIPLEERDRVIRFVRHLLDALDERLPRIHIQHGVGVQRHV